MDKLKPLRRTVTPYVGQTLILVCITVFTAYVAHKTSDWKFFAVMLLLWPLSAFAYLYFGLKYRVLWDDSDVVMRVSGGPERRIPYGEITSVGYEVSTSQSRPLRRIVIHGRTHHPKEFVDVSLRHFNLEDIQQLIKVIRKHRPELTIPKAPRWIGDPGDWLTIEE